MEKSLLCILTILVFASGCAQSSSESGHAGSTGSTDNAGHINSTGSTQPKTNDITSFRFLADSNTVLSENVTGTISGTSISLTVPNYTDVSNLMPAVEVSPGAQISPTGAQNFNSPLTYTLTGSDEGEQIYTVTVVNDSYNLNLGDVGPAGGYIFSINSEAVSDGWKYMEVAPATLATNAVYGAMSFTHSTSGGVGDGLLNTANIIANDSSTVNKAADHCDNYSLDNGGNTYDDWFLPTGASLMEIYNNLIQAGIPEGNSPWNTDAPYWGSDQTNTNKARTVNFVTASEAPKSKDQENNCVAVRRF